MAGSAWRLAIPAWDVQAVLHLEHRIQNTEAAHGAALNAFCILCSVFCILIPMKTTFLATAIALVACGGAAYEQPQQQSGAAQPAAGQTVADPRPANAPEQKPAFEGQTDAPLRVTNVAFD